MASNKCYPWILSSDVVYQNGIGTDQINPVIIDAVSLRSFQTQTCLTILHRKSSTKIPPPPHSQNNKPPLTNKPLIFSERK